MEGGREGHKEKGGLREGMKLKEGGTQRERWLERGSETEEERDAKREVA